MADGLAEGGIVLHEMDILDRDDPSAIRYPAIKFDSDGHAAERKLATVARDISIPGVGESAYFPLDFCMNDAVINAIAKKYRAGDENYPEGDDFEEHFLIGTAAFENRRRLDCPYMHKACAKIDAAKNFDLTGAFAIYLLDLDGTDDNRQKFLVMTKTTVHVL